MARNTAIKCLMASMTFVGVLTSCHDDMGTSADGVGGIAPAVDLNTAVTSSQKASRSTTVTANDLALTIKKTDGSYSHTWASVADYDPTTTFAVGEYTVEATYGSIEDEGFDRPAYAGSTTVNVIEGQTTPVSLTATLINSMVSISYTDEFKEYMSSWDAELHSTGGSYIYYGPEETNPVYLRPGEVTLDLELTKANGVSATLRVAKFTAKPRYHYHITVGLQNGIGGAQVQITFDENLEKEDVTIDISDEILNAPAPVINGDGITNGGNVNYLEYSTPAKAAVNIVARGGIASVTMTSKSRSLVAQGWKTEVDLSTMAENIQSRLGRLGLVTRGVVNPEGNFGVVDFTNVVKSLRLADGTEPSEFDIVVVDKYGKVSEHFTFTMTLTELMLALSNPSEIALAATELEVDLTYNGANPSGDVKFQVQNDRGIWENVTVRSIGEPVDGVYRVALTVPATTRAINLRAVTGSKVSETLTINRNGVSAFGLEVPENDIWTRTAKLVLTSESADASILAHNATVYLSTDGSTYTATNIAGTNGATLSLTGLNPGTAYFVKVSVTDLESEACTPVRFATEAMTGVPNGDFETLTSKYSTEKALQGGQWSIARGTNYDNYAAYNVSEANGWATTNSKTMSGSNQNTWFAIPSVFNTSLTYVSTVPPQLVIGTGGGSETPASYAGFTAHSGTNAMVVRNVAWDPAGETPSVWYKAFVGSNEYYNHTVPNIDHHSVGKMYLGSYSYNNGTETYTEGVAFASRPKTLRGYYTYTPDAGDTADNGVVTVELLNGATVIAQGSTNLSAASSYTAFSVPLTYIANAPKATSLRIMVASSKHASLSMAEETRNVKVTTYNSRYESYQHGATLVVDNFTFDY